MLNDKRLKKLPNQYQNRVKKLILDLVYLFKNERLNRNLSQEQMAEMLNVELKTYQAYEQGTRKPSLEVLMLVFLLFDYELKAVKK